MMQARTTWITDLHPRKPSIGFTSESFSTLARISSWVDLVWQDNMWTTSSMLPSGRNSWRIQEPNSYRKAWKTSMNAIVSRWICNLTLRFKLISMHRGPCDKILAVEIINLGAHYIDQFLSMFRYDNIADALSSQLEQKIRVLLQLSNLLMKLAQLWNQTQMHVCYHIPSIARKIPSKSVFWYGRRRPNASCLCSAVSAIIICLMALILSSEEKNWSRNERCSDNTTLVINHIIFLQV